jgi:hypothetical protein
VAALSLAELPLALTFEAYVLLSTGPLFRARYSRYCFPN